VPARSDFPLRRSGRFGSSPTSASVRVPRCASSRRRTWATCAPRSVISRRGSACAERDGGAMRERDKLPRPGHRGAVPRAGDCWPGTLGGSVRDRCQEAVARCQGLRQCTSRSHGWGCSIARESPSGFESLFRSWVVNNFALRARLSPTSASQSGIDSGGHRTSAVRTMSPVDDHLRATRALRQSENFSLACHIPSLRYGGRRPPGARSPNPRGGARGALPAQAFEALDLLL